MQLTDQRRINASPEAVWAAILDPDVLRSCVPGCESMTGSPEAGYEAVFVQKVGPLSARYSGIIALSDIDPARAVTIAAEGKGGIAGFAKGGAKLMLAPDGDDTILTYEVTANLGGPLASLGKSLIDVFAGRMADGFFARFQAALDGATPDPMAKSGTPEKGWLARVFRK